MKKITFKNGQAPYLSDTTLNQMQDNIEEAINEVDSKFIKGTYTYSQALPAKTPVGIDIPVTGMKNGEHYSVFVNAKGLANYGDWVTALNAYIGTNKIGVRLFNNGSGPTTGDISIEYMLVKV